MFLALIILFVRVGEGLAIKKSFVLKTSLKNLGLGRKTLKLLHN